MDAPPPTRLKVKGKDRYLYRAVDSTGQTIEFLLTAQRDAVAAPRFLRKALSAAATPAPRGITVDKNPAYLLAVEKLKNANTLRRCCRLRRCKFLNNIVEQDHRAVKRRIRARQGFRAFHAAWRTIQGIETVNMIRKGQVRWLTKGDITGQVAFINGVFGLGATA